MKIKIIIHEAEEGGLWAEVPSIPGCATQGETFEELLMNLYEAIEGCLSAEFDQDAKINDGKIMEIAI
ncbi:MAG: type II toxin-antitoxin system HicB family antitoxin [Atribacterota bacterium]|nr:type II toxin-antitoxin system HicB family antitoxin [Atribacterota bacterium]